MGVSHTLFRRFFWAENILWKEDILDRRVTVVLAGKDIVVDTKIVRAYLTGSDHWAIVTRDWEDWEDEGSQEDSLDVLWHPDLDHGQVFHKKRTRSQLVRIARGFCEQ